MRIGKKGHVWAAICKETGDVRMFKTKKKAIKAVMRECQDIDKDKFWDQPNWDRMHYVTDDGNGNMKIIYSLKRYTIG